MKLYKLTDNKGCTYNNTQWGPGVAHSGTGTGGLCSGGWIHAYEHPLIAVLMNPAHGNFYTPLLWECEGEVAIRDGQLKCGCKTLTTIKQIPLPEITNIQRIRIAILYAKLAGCGLDWTCWANAWLSGKDRSSESAYIMYSEFVVPVPRLGWDIAYAAYCNVSPEKGEYLTPYYAASSIITSASFIVYADLIKLILEALSVTD